MEKNKKRERNEYFNMTQLKTRIIYKILSKVAYKLTKFCRTPEIQLLLRLATFEYLQYLDIATRDLSKITKSRS